MIYPTTAEPTTIHIQRRLAPDCTLDLTIHRVGDIAKLSGVLCRNGLIQSTPVTFSGIPMTISLENLKKALASLQTMPLKVVNNCVSPKLMGGMPTNETGTRSLKDLVEELNSPITKGEHKATLRLLALASAKQAPEFVKNASVDNTPPYIDELCSLAQSRDPEIVNSGLNAFQEMLSTGGEKSLIVHDGLARYLRLAMLTNPFDFSRLFQETVERFIRRKDIPQDQRLYFEAALEEIKQSKANKYVVDKLAKKMKKALEFLQKEEDQEQFKHHERHVSELLFRDKFATINPKLNTQRQGIFISFCRALDEGIRKKSFFDIPKLLEMAGELHKNLESLHIGPQSAQQYFALRKAFNGVVDALIDSGCEHIPSEEKETWLKLAKDHRTQFNTSDKKTRKFRSLFDGKTPYRSEELEYCAAYTIEAVGRLSSDKRRRAHVAEKSKQVLKGALGLTSLILSMGEGSSSDIKELIDFAKDAPEIFEASKNLLKIRILNNWYSLLRQWEAVTYESGKGNILTTLKQAIEDGSAIHRHNWYPLFQAISFLADYAESATDEEIKEAVDLLQEMAYSEKFRKQKKEEDRKIFPQIQKQAIATLNRLAANDNSRLSEAAEEAIVWLRDNHHLGTMIEETPPLSAAYRPNPGSEILDHAYRTQHPLMPHVATRLYQLEHDRFLTENQECYVDLQGTNETESKNLYDLVNAFLENDKKRLLVVEGEPGSGKTLFSQFLHRRLLQKYPFNNLITFWEYLPSIRKDLEECHLMDAFLQRHNLTDQKRSIVEQPLLLILDSYDELTAGEDHTLYHKFGNIYSKNRLWEWPQLKVIITCRPDVVIRNPRFFIPYKSPTTPDNEAAAKVTINRFEEQQYKQYLDRFLRSMSQMSDYQGWTTDKYIETLKELKSDVSPDSAVGMLGNPFSLSVIAAGLPKLINKQGGQFSSLLFEKDLIENYLQQFFARSAEIGEGHAKYDYNTLIKKYNIFCLDLVGKMIEHNVVSVSYDDNDMEDECGWSQFFSEKGEIPIIRRGCPLISSPGGSGKTIWQWQHDRIFRYFIAKIYANT